MSVQVEEGVYEGVVEDSAHRMYSGADNSIPPTRGLRHPMVTPEDAILDSLQHCTAFESSVNFVYTLGTQRFLQKWVRYITHRRPDGKLGEDNRNAIHLYLQQIVRAFLTADLQLEIVTSTVNNSWVVYPFGQTHSHISFPCHIFEKSELAYSAFLAHLNRMLITDQVAVSCPGYSAKGGAFRRIQNTHSCGNVVFSKFAYNSYLSFHFPRFQFISCFMYTLACDSFVVDDASGVDVEHAVRTDIAANYAEKMPPMKDMVLSMRSFANQMRVLMFKALQSLVAQFSLQLSQAHVSTSVVGEGDGGGTPNPRALSRDERASIRRIAFFFPYLQMLTNCVRDFSLKGLSACWYKSHTEIVDKVLQLYPLNFN